MNKTFIGIDPGLKGGLAYITNQTIKAMPMPIAGNELDTKTIIHFLTEEEFPVVCIEAVHSMPGQGVSSTFKFGFGTGMLHGIVRALGLPLITVAPQTWKKAILAGTDKSKEAAIDYCMRKYPTLNLYPTERSKKMSDGMAEAVCIAEYAKKINQQ
jgi:crossover junction endodeoxyribonuclease RuvC